jgi:hypothetical protein
LERSHWACNLRKLIDVAAGSDNVIDGGDGDETIRVFAHNGASDLFMLAADGQEVTLSRLNLGAFVLRMVDVEMVLVQGKAGSDKLVMDNVEDAGVIFVDFRGSDGDDELRSRGDAEVEFFANGGKGDDVLVCRIGSDQLLGRD